LAPDVGRTIEAYGNRIAELANLLALMVKGESDGHRLSGIIAYTKEYVARCLIGANYQHRQRF
jgi:hypothetical protein